MFWFNVLIQFRPISQSRWFWLIVWLSRFFFIQNVLIKSFPIICFLLAVFFLYLLVGVGRVGRARTATGASHIQPVRMENVTRGPGSASASPATAARCAIAVSSIIASFFPFFQWKKTIASQRGCFFSCICGCADLNFCGRNSPCSNYAVCHNTAEGPDFYRCVCPDGYSGADCSQPVDPCQAVSSSSGEDFCGNGGECFNNNGTAYCRCASGWTGEKCNTGIYKLKEFFWLTFFLSLLKMVFIFLCFVPDRYWRLRR